MQVFLECISLYLNAKFCLGIGVHLPKAIIGSKVIDYVDPFTYLEVSLASVGWCLTCVLGKLIAPRQLFCWAPLLSGSLCHRCDPSGRCPIHGRIVKRDKITGRPINMNDRKLLQTEMESKRLARQKSEFSCLMV
ncbi:unnamed protein product [Schistosoma mattheei]|uniref:Uncharacterized protein n=1 Tax=Schistosoma mattheei TaxID=31246 RepID=A0A183NKV5_9TREM|nr:unnamed protein product [Schistosoma mattheei]